LAEAVQIATSTRKARNGSAAGSDASQASDEAASPPAGLRLDGARLLLVEDNPINQLVAKSMLTFAGASIEAVDNGRAAVDLLATDAARFDLVLMDVQMPEMDGFEATRRIRNDLKLNLPVLAMTAGVLHSEREQCIECGMNDFIAKPIDVDEMLQTIARNLPANRQIQTAVSKTLPS
jgi:CheY-like chemotaxis protein